MLPNFFSKMNIPEKLPKGMEAAIQKLKKSKNKQDCLNKAYKILTSKYRGCKLYTFLCFYNLFITDLNKLWSRKGCMHCTTLGYLLRILLVRSGWFRDEDIMLKWTLLYYITPHQYLRINLGKKVIDVDVWAAAYGIELGDHAQGLHFLTRTSVD